MSNTTQTTTTADYTAATKDADGFWPNTDSACLCEFCDSQATVSLVISFSDTHTMIICAATVCDAHAAQD